MSGLTKDDFLNAVRTEARTIQTGSVWMHYKGGTYVVRGHGINTDTGEVTIIYQRVDGPNYDPVAEANLLWCRRATEWLDTTACGTQRFTRVR